MTTVTAKLTTPDGRPAAGAIVRFALAAEQVIAAGVVVPAHVEAVADAAGECSLDLYSDADGVAYSVLIVYRQTRITKQVTVPNVQTIALPVLLGWVDSVSTTPAMSLRIDAGPLTIGAGVLTI